MHERVNDDKKKNRSVTTDESFSCMKFFQMYQLARVNQIREDVTSLTNVPVLLLTCQYLGIQVKLEKSYFFSIQDVRYLEMIWTWP